MKMFLDGPTKESTVDCKTTEAGAKWMARAPNLGGATTNVK